MKEMPNYYSIIPATVRYDNKIRDKAKLLYSEITALSNKEGYCYATNKYFANLYNVSTTTISTLIKELIDNGYIESNIIYKEGSKEILYRYLKLFKGGIKENLKDNNTSNNNNIIINKGIDIFDYYQQEIGQLTPSQYELLNTYIEKLDPLLIKEAINITVNSGAKNMNYLKAVLNNFISKGYKYIADIEYNLETTENNEIDDNLQLFEYNWIDDIENN